MDVPLAARRRGRIGLLALLATTLGRWLRAALLRALPTVALLVALQIASLLRTPVVLLTVLAAVLPVPCALLAHEAS
jgi:hypothetical protein